MHKPNRPKSQWQLALALLALLSVTLVLGGAPASAQVREVTSSAVLPVMDASGSRDSLLADRVTDALALALEASGSYRVVARAEVVSELENLGVQVPLTESEQVLIGEKLQVEKVFSATLTQLAVNEKNGSVRIGLDLLALDVGIRALLAGATVTFESKRIPGFSGDVIPVINQALREACEKAVIEMEKSKRRHGSILLVDDVGNITTDLGVNDGVGVATKLLVLRGFWDKEREETIMRNIGTLEVTSAQVRLSTARSISGQVPRIGDRVYPLYTTPAAAKQFARRATANQSMMWAAGVAALLGLYSVATGPTVTSAPEASAFLFQQAPGATTVVRLDLQRESIPDAQRTQAWLFYRGPSAGFSAVADNQNFLVGVDGTGGLDFWEDWPARQVGITFNKTFTYIDVGGEQADGTVTITYNHPELVAGSRYYYKLRRVVQPIRSNLPIAGTAQVDPFVDVEFEVDPADALSEASAALGPVTYHTPAQLISPTETGEPVSPTSAEFEWAPTLGADQYQVMIYGDALLTQLVSASPILTWTGETRMSWTLSGVTLQGSRTYYWVVGSRTIGEVLPRCMLGTNYVNWILSAKEAFATVTMPPGPAAAAAGGAGSARPSDVVNWWRARRLPQP